MAGPQSSFVQSPFRRPLGLTQQSINPPREGKRLLFFASRRKKTDSLPFFSLFRDGDRGRSKRKITYLFFSSVSWPSAPGRKVLFFFRLECSAPPHSPCNLGPHDRSLPLFPAGSLAEFTGLFLSSPPLLFFPSGPGTVKRFGRASSFFPP